MSDTSDLKKTAKINVRVYTNVTYNFGQCLGLQKVMYKTQLVTTKGDSIRTFVSSSRPATRFGSEGVEITYTDSDTSFTIMGSWNVIIEKVVEEDEKNLAFAG